jgi:hypothetical protein
LLVWYSSSRSMNRLSFVCLSSMVFSLFGWDG